MSRDMRDLSPETYVVNPDTSSGIRLFAGRSRVYWGSRGFGCAASDRYEPPETARWLTKQSNEQSNERSWLASGGGETAVSGTPPQSSREPHGDPDGSREVDGEPTVTGRGRQPWRSKQGPLFVAVLDGDGGVRSASSCLVGKREAQAVERRGSGARSTSLVKAGTTPAFVLARVFATERAGVPAYVRNQPRWRRPEAFHRLPLWHGSSSHRHRRQSRFRGARRRRARSA